jgi:predicted transcriptional regulator
VTGGDMVPGLGPLESAIMTVVWDAGQPIIVGAARERLNYQASGGSVPAYTTVMTVMNILWHKALLSRAKNLGEGHPRAWWYEARVTREEYLADIIRPALECAPDPAAVMRCAMDGSRR